MKAIIKGNTMKALTAGDLVFLALEKRNQPMHIGGLFLFKPPEDAPDDFVYQLVQKLRKAGTFAVDPFNRVLHKGVFWKEDEQFDIDHHFRHIALPKPGRIRELLVYVSQEHGTLLDRSHALWECHVIEGIEDNRFAMYFKIHHAVTDGVAAMRLIKKALSSHISEPLSYAPWAMPIKRRKSRSHTREASNVNMIKEQFNTIPTISKELWQGIKKFKDSNQTKPRNTPSSILNNSITSSRRVVAQSYDISRFKAIAKHYGVTINDIVLAICSGVLRNYLFPMGALPKKSLTAFVPVSLRNDNSDSGNQIAFMLANLATDVADVEKRLQIISDSIKENKERFSRMNQKEAINYTILFYALSMTNLVTGFMPKRQGFNLIISNVPGSREPLYWNGAQLDAMYPLSVLMDGQALNITLASYVDKIEFGIVANTKTLPKIQNMLELIENELQTFETRVEINVNQEKFEQQQSETEAETITSDKKMPETA